MSLNNLATHLSELGRREEALARAQEATSIYGELAAARPDAFGENFIRSLLTQALVSEDARAAAQAAWLAVHLRPSAAMTLGALWSAFQLSPAGDALEAPAAAAAALLVPARSSGGPDEQTRGRIAAMLAQAAVNAGAADDSKALQAWYEERRLFDPAVLFPLLDAEIARVVGDHWLFDRAAFVSPDSP